MSVPWETIQEYIEGAYAINGQVERSVALELGEADGISDDAVDAIDAIGSRIFRGDTAVADTKGFLDSVGHLTGA